MSPFPRQPPSSISEAIDRKAYEMTDGEDQAAYTAAVSHLVAFARTLCVLACDRGEEALEELDDYVYERNRKAKAARRARQGDDE